MNWHVVLRVQGILLTVFSLTLLPPAAVGLLYGDGAVEAFIGSFAITLAIGLTVWLPVRHLQQELRLREGFVVVAMFWTVLGLFGALPFLLAAQAPLSITDAIFESISGLTTTGATVITRIDSLPHAILWYRQQLQWLGGMGIIVLAVAILPILGIGGMQLYRAETPGPVKDNKLTPRITETAKALWLIYLSLTVACALGYWWAGMEPFDAIGHSFSTVAIGGFSTHDASLGYFDSTLIMLVAIVFMVISGVNFALHFMVLNGRRFRVYWEDSEFKAYLNILLVTSLVTVVYLLFTHTLEPFDAVIHGIFQVVSIATTTGFTTTDYFIWPGFLPVLLLFTSFVGGCANSTAGGMKVVRVLLLYKQGKREIVRLIHPSAQILVKMGGKPLPERVIDAVWGFFALYVVTFAVMMLTLMATGLDQVTAFSAVAACINNLGPGLGEVGVNFASVNAPAKWVLCFAMLLGRLEIFTLLVLLTPTFWRL
ncbi:MAG: TrkH family potassium uptake protein [Candidatus Competibacteraceae bacterium]|nr:TrkH family potassium uptake protein [Candidatus Competibacteraceae bacterium]